MSLYKGR